MRAGRGMKMAEEGLGGWGAEEREEGGRALGCDGKGGG